MSVAEPSRAPRTAWKGTTFWTGWFLTGFVALFLLFDGAAKLMNAAPVLDACARLEVPERVIPALGVVLIASTVLYVVPWTSLLGAILLTGYLGGAVWTHLRMNEPVFPILFPILVGAMIWGGLCLREPRLRALIPLRRSVLA